MPRLPALKREDLQEFEPFFTMIEQIMGFVPNSLLIMARQPAMLKAFGDLSYSLIGADGRVDGGLKQLIAHIASRTAGCQYCMAHTANSARQSGIDVKKIEAIWEYETSPLFSEAERAAFVFAQGAASVPNAVSDEDVSNLKKYYDEDQILEILGVISLFGFLNRWNDTLATELEASPLQFSKDHLSQSGWKVGKHHP